MNIEKSNDFQFLLKKIWEDKSLSHDLSFNRFKKYVTKYFHLFPDNSYMIYDLNREYVGCFILNEDVFGYEMISYITIDEKFRGLGVSRDILKFILEDKTKNYCLYCEERLLGFWKKMGFKETGFLKKDILGTYYLLVVENHKVSERKYERIPII